MLTVPFFEFDQCALPPVPLDFFYYLCKRHKFTVKAHLMCGKLYACRDSNAICA